ncbi:hypothetical protein [Candidatus Marithrix sp. Canyon 246]|uniref:hypothetical protein n=1 Tax=Candidatus Marithrix sp. Canyon 246 TaxID=1827136 RepID=UPI00084A1E2D|nr:hypothetical protein [Candidatus Marithrix sp. Canyon 246]
MAGISAGLSGKSKLTQSKLSREFSAQIQSHYFKSFAAQRNICLDNLLSNFEVLSKPIFQDDNQNPFSVNKDLAVLNNELFIMAGTVLSSTGNTTEAEKLFVQARYFSKNDEEKALASFNLFYSLYLTILLTTFSTTNISFIWCNLMISLI